MFKSLPFYILFFYCSVTFSQTVINKAVINLDADDSSKPYTYVARDAVHYHAGYHYSAQNGEMIGKIDETLLLPTDYAQGDEIININERTDLDTSLAVGLTTGLEGVTATGGASYTVPIFTPEGTGGMQPNIVLVYNSQSGNGLAGLGWSILGISCVSRIGKDRYFDNEIDAVKLNNTDNLILDGKRLLKTGQQYGNITEYAFQQEDFSRTKGTLVGSNSSFVTVLKNGTEILYGHTNNSKLIPEGSAVPYAWFVNRIKDRKGNYTDYIYDSEEGEIVIKEIKYTGNIMNGIIPYNSIKFYYTSREDRSEYYVAGKKLKKTKLLRMIKVFSNNQLVRTYKLNHNKRLYSELNEIEEFGLNGEQVNSTIVHYGKEASVSFDNASFIDQSQYEPYKYLHGDYNGDGHEDIIIARTEDFHGLKKNVKLYF